MVVTGTLTPDSWVPALHEVSVFPDKYSADENMNSPKCMPRACQVLAKSLVLGKNITSIYLCHHAHWGSQRVERPALLKSQCLLALLFFGGKYLNIQL